VKFKSSEQYWNDRYNSKGNSGAGSYGNLAEFKSSVLNKFIDENKIQSVIEFGCGDGNQLLLSNYPIYDGYDISHSSISMCKKIFNNDKTKNFYHVSQYNRKKYDLSLSLDVIYHLVEDNVYRDYLKKLFDASNKFVIIYSSNNEKIRSDSPHVKHRNFMKDIPSNFQCIKTIKNIYPYNINHKKITSFSDFYIFRRN